VYDQSQGSAAVFVFTDNSSVVCLHGSIVLGSLAWKEEEYSIREELVEV
jgi:hypothetical protein